MLLILSSIIRAAANCPMVPEITAMVDVGNSPNRAEQRKKPRRHFSYGAVVIIDRKGTFVPCSLSDISENGARIAFDSEIELPEHFILLLTPAGDARRRCRVVWKKGTTVGVSFRDPAA